MKTKLLVGFFLFSVELITGQDFEIIPEMKHASNINSVCISPDGRYALSGSLDKTIKLWDLKTGKEIKTLSGHLQLVTSVSFSPDGKLAVSGSWDKTVKLWDIEKGIEIKTFKGHSNRVESVCFSPDGKYILSGGFDEMIKLWDVESGREIKSFLKHSGVVTTICFSSDGKYVLSGSGSNATTAGLWEVETGKQIKSFNGHSNSVFSVCFSPNGKYALSGSYDKTMKLWDLQTGNEMRTFSGHTDGVRKCCFSPDGRYILSGSDDKTLKLWDVQTGKEIRTFTGHRGEVFSCCFSPDGKYVLSGSTDKTIKLWEVQTGEEIHHLPSRSQSVSGINNSSAKENKQNADSIQIAIPKIWAVVIGISEYKNPDITDLRYAHADALSFADFLRSPNGGAIPPERMTVLTNQQATRSSIIQALTKTFYQAFETDMIVFYIASHGQPDPVGSEMYFLGYDADPNNPEGTAVSQIDVQKIIGRSRAGKKVIIADACHSGGVGTDTDVGGRSGNEAEATVIHKLLEQIAFANDGTIMLTASSSTEHSFEDSKFGGGHGVFTHFLVEGLTGKADENKNKLISVREIYEYVYRQVAASTNGKQHPELKGKFNNNMPLSVIK